MKNLWGAWQRVKYGTFLKSERIIKAILENPKAASKYTLCNFQICKFLTTLGVLLANDLYL